MFFGTTLTTIKIGTFVNNYKQVGSSEIILPLKIFLVTMRDSDFGTNFSILKNSSEIFCSTYLCPFNYNSQNIQNADFTPFLTV